MREFWQRKVATLFLPWIFCETVLWFYVVLRKGGISVTAWLLFLLGYHHTTYYLTILAVFYVIYFSINNFSGQEMYYFSRFALIGNLLHQFFAGIVVAVTNHWDFFILTLCRPWIILGITVGTVMVMEWCFRGKMQWVRMLVGER